MSTPDNAREESTTSDSSASAGSPAVTTPPVNTPSASARSDGVPIDGTTYIPVVDADTEEMTASDVAAVENLPVGNAMLLVQRGPDAGSRFLLDNESVSVGRHPDSDIFLDDISVSRRHANFDRTDTGYAVTDLGSLNGTYVNRDRIDTEVHLSGGDEVQVGKYRLIYFAGANEQVAPA